MTDNMPWLDFVHDDEAAGPASTTGVREPPPVEFVRGPGKISVRIEFEKLGPRIRVAVKHFRRRTHSEQMLEIGLVQGLFEPDRAAPKTSVPEADGVKMMLHDDNRVRLDIRGQQDDLGDVGTLIVPFTNVVIL